jgi:hypothetical protein
VSPRRRGFLAFVGVLALSGPWALLATQLFSGSDLKGATLGGIGLIFLISLIAAFMAGADLSIYEDGYVPQQQHQSPPMSQWMQEQRAHEEYMRRRAEDSRMRTLMNPNSQQAPQTDWFGR